MRFLGFVFLAFILSGVLLVADSIIPSHFLNDFIQNNYIETFAALIGLNITASIFLLSQIADIELRNNQENGIFIHTRKEIKQSIYFLLSSFILSFVLLAVRPELGQLHTKPWIYVYHGLNVVILSIFFLSLYAIYELFCAAFTLNNRSK